MFLVLGCGKVITSFDFRVEFSKFFYQIVMFMVASLCLVLLLVLELLAEQVQVRVDYSGLRERVGLEKVVVCSLARLAESKFPDFVMLKTRVRL